MELKNNIKVEIVKQGYNSVASFCEINGLSYQKVNRFIRHEASNFHFQTVVEICRALNRDVGDLFYIDWLCWGVLWMSNRVSFNKKRNELINFYGCCVICGFDYEPVLEIHHILPVSSGGSNDVDNLFPLCPNCHAIVHSFIYDSTEKYGENYTDNWLFENRTKIQREKTVELAFEILQGRFPDERIINRS